MTLLDVAVDANVAWCAAASGGPGTRPRAGCWLAPPDPPPFFPDLVTVGPGVAAADVAAVLHDRPTCSVKDSFADVDLTAAGFTVLLEATWIGLRITTDGRPGWTTARDRAGLEAWSTAAGLPEPLPDHLLDRPDVRLLARQHARHPVAGAAVHQRGTTAGVADVFGHDPWPELLQTLTGLDVVGYEHGADLTAATAAGMAELGPLRVWIRWTPSGGPAGADARPAC